MYEILVIKLCFPLDALHVRTILIHHQEQLYKLYIAFGICQYVWLLCGYSHITARHIGIYRHIPNAMYRL